MKAIVAVTGTWGIGFEGDLAFRIPDDMRRFRETTWGHAVVMGRRTYESLGGRPLPGRRCIVVSKGDVPGVETYRDPYAAASAAGDDSFVIGGESVYRELLAFCDEAYVTFACRTDGSDIPADRFFPDLGEDTGWHLRSLDGPYLYGHLRYEYRVYRNRDVKPVAVSPNSR